MPVAVSFRSSMSMCSGRPSSTVTSPPVSPAATRKVATTSRSGMTAWVAGSRRSTPSTSIREVPAPVILAPMALRKSARSRTSGSRAAFSITVVPLASTAAISTLSVPVWLGYSSTTRLPTSRGTPPTVDATRPSTLPWEEVNSAPSDLEGPQVHVDRPGAEVVAAGHRHPGPAAPGQERPEDHHRRPHLLDQLVGGLGGELGRGGHDQLVGPVTPGHAWRPWPRAPRP